MSSKLPESLRGFFALLHKDPLILPLYLPSTIYGITSAMLIPVLPIYAANFDVTYTLIGLFLAGNALGMVLGDIPAGLLTRSLSPRRVMLLGIGGMMLATAGLFAASTIWAALLLRIAGGFCSAQYNISRHAYIAGIVQVHNRGKRIAVLGGVHRLSRLFGPTLGGLVAGGLGLRITFLIVAGLNVLVIINLLAFAPHSPPRPDKHPEKGTESNGLLDVLRETRARLLPAGSGQIFVQMTRGGIQAVLPLYGADVVGLSVTEIGFLMSLLSLLDTLIFFPAGIIMDRFGRKYTIVPGFVIQATGMLLIPLTGSFITMAAVAAVIGAGNGLTAGSMMTLGADLAPPHARGEFLGIWRLIGDAGGMGGPFVAGIVATTFALPVAALAVAGTGVLAASTFAFFVPETLRHDEEDV